MRLTYIFFFFSVFLPIFSTSSFLSVLSPGQSPVSIPFSIANFGRVPYGQNIIADLYFAKPLNACLPQAFESHAQRRPFALIALRGDCPFLSKAYIAQEMGASMLLVVDNILEMTEFVTPMASNDTDDNSNLTIPTLFIAKNDGDPLLLQAALSQIQINATFSIPKSKQVNYTFWLTTSQPESMRLVSSFQPFFEKLGKSKDSFNFEVHYTGLFHCKFCNFTNYTYFPDNCISGGRFCSAYPEGADPSIAVHYIYEDLRQICLFRHYPEAWWTYVKNFANRCLRDESSYSACSRIILNELEENLEIKNLEGEIMKCFNESFIIPESGTELNPQYHDNVLLQQERKISVERAVGFWPSVTINEEAYKGNLAGDNVFSAVCEAFELAPDVCSKKDEEGSETTVNADVIMIVVVMTVFVTAILLIIYCARQKKRLEAKTRAYEISEIIGKYQSLREERNNLA